MSLLDILWSDEAKRWTGLKIVTRYTTVHEAGKKCNGLPGTHMYIDVDIHEVGIVQEGIHFTSKYTYITAKTLTRVLDDHTKPKIKSQEFDGISSISHPPPRLAFSPLPQTYLQASHF